MQERNSWQILQRRSHGRWGPYLYMSTPFLEVKTGTLYGRMLKDGLFFPYSDGRGAILAMSHALRQVNIPKSCNACCGFDDLNGWAFFDLNAIYDEYENEEVAEYENEEVDEEFVQVEDV